MSESQTFVIDVGCATYGDADSVKALIEHFKPKRLLGLDPGLRADQTLMVDKTLVELRPYAAWTANGFVRFHDDGSRGFVSSGNGRRQVEARDLGSIITMFPGLVVLKLDCEGGEYELIPHLIATGAYANVEKWLIEWHGDPIPDLPFEWEPWWM